MEEKKKKPKKVRLSEEAISEAIWSEAETINGIPISAEEILVILRSEIIDISKKIAKSKRQKSKKFWNANLFKSRDEHPLIEVLYDYFQVAKQIDSIPSFGEYYDYGKFGRHLFPPAIFVDKGALVKETWSVDLADSVFMIFQIWNTERKKEERLRIKREQTLDLGKNLRVEEECLRLIEHHKSKTRTADHNIELMEEMIAVYQKLGSLAKLEQALGTEVSRESFRHLVRVPSELRELVNNGKLSSDPIIATEIAIHATDYFEWDQEESGIKDVISLAKDMAKTFKDQLSLRREFFTTKDDYSKPVTSSKTSELKEIFEEWPVKESKYEWERGDRTQNQYRFIVFYSKVIGAVRFVRRWEYEKGRRISFAWASQMIDEIKQSRNVKEFLQEHQDEFND